MRTFGQLAASTGLAVGIAVGFSSSAAAAPTPFGSDLAAAPNGGMQSGFTVVDLPGGPGAAAAGYVAPADGVITGWRVRTDGTGGSMLRFHVVRGNTSVHKGPPVNVGTTDGVSATFPDWVLVKQGDKIGLTNDSGDISREIFRNSLPGASYVAWGPPLAANETRAPLAVENNSSLLVQADLDSSLAVCAGVNVTMVGTPGNDVIFGTAGNDVIAAHGGDDIVRGLGGDDIICGGDGNDKLKGGAGKDRLYGEAGRDKLRGGNGKDSCFGGADKDAIGCEKAKQN